MNRIGKAFENGKVFIGFLTGGDPNLAKTEEYILAMVEAGVGLVEIGVPFSDPVAEGPVIERANQRALAAGATLPRLFEMVERLRQKTQVPLVFLSYLNPIFRYGYPAFFSRCQEAGVDGVILPDLPFEEKGELAGVAAEHGVEVISLVAPTSEGRIAAIAKQATGFVYLVSSMGVTGVRETIETDVESMVRLVRENSKTPVAVGFGISSPAQAAAMARQADGAIVGSAIVRIIEQYGEEAKEPLTNYLREMARAVREQN